MKPGCYQHQWLHRPSFLLLLLLLTFNIVVEMVNGGGGGGHHHHQTSSFDHLSSTLLDIAPTIDGDDHHHSDANSGNKKSIRSVMFTTNHHDQSGIMLEDYLLTSYMALANDSCSHFWCETGDTRDEVIHEHNSAADDFDDDETNYIKHYGLWLDAPPDDILYMPPPPMPPSIQAALFSSSDANISMRDFIISEDPVEGYRCNFCKLFADPSSRHHQQQDQYHPNVGGSSDDEFDFGPNGFEDGTDDGSTLLHSSVASNKDTEAFVSSFYLFIFSIVILCVLCLLLLVKYKKWKIFPATDACPILTSGLLGGGGHHHHKSSSDGSPSPSDTRIPVVNEKSPQSIIMDAPLTSLGKKSTISTTGKYWKRVPPPNQSLISSSGNGSANIFSMEDRSRIGLRNFGGGSSTLSGMSDHPYSDAASCTSSPVYAELDPSVAGSCHTPTLIGPPGTGSVVSGYGFANQYSEVPEHIHLRNHHHHPHLTMSNSLLTDSSTYDNAAYLPASSQQHGPMPFISSTPYGGSNHSTQHHRSLRRLAAQRSAAMNNNGNLSGTPIGQVNTPLLAGHHPYHHPYHHSPSPSISSGSGGGQFQHFLTSGRPLKKPRPSQIGNGNNGQTMQTSFGFRTMSGRNVDGGGVVMNHYVDNDLHHFGHPDMLLQQDHHNHHQQHQQQQRLSSPPPGFGNKNKNNIVGSTNGSGSFSSFLASDNISSNGSHGKSSSSSTSQYTEMPLLSGGCGGGGGGHGHGHQRGIGGGSSIVGNGGMSETISGHDLNSASSSSSAVSSAGGISSALNSSSTNQSSTSLKRPLPPVPGGVRL